MLQVEEEKKEGVISRETLAVGMARLGQETHQIVFGKLEDLLDVDFGAPLHSLAICGTIHPLEQEVSRNLFRLSHRLYVTLFDS